MNIDEAIKNIREHAERVEKWRPHTNTREGEYLFRSAYKDFERAATKLILPLIDEYERKNESKNND